MHECTVHGWLGQIVRLEPKNKNRKRWTQVSAETKRAHSLLHEDCLSFHQAGEKERMCAHAHMFTILWHAQCSLVITKGNKKR